ncbi:MAG: adenylosuccinate lyase [Candidatus Omnitrophica bacterium]|nr:adenylosuccinate lyase [Candidatus Omnitrophota bacterium]MCF7876841.1 adenylosuccinate lyase [Candidatus Omnitrophota bacterium]MCF7877900.1 adenylosuccinate lyase [Candidatus Omnitrophota bacterium]MCF7893090.1 adenylosuccinate lyase [Candidatus Omnitrophota bacterium]
MIKRYTPKKIGRIWQEDEKFKRFLKIEALLCESLEKQKKIPKGTSKKFAKVKISIDKIKDIEKETRHDIVAFLKHISPQIGPAAQYLHRGLTSSDLLDTTLAWQIKDTYKIILSDLDKLITVVKAKAIKYKDTICMARSHGMHAEIYSFGLKFLYLYNDLLEERKKLSDSFDYVVSGKISGAVGTFAYFSPKTEEYICKKIGINWAKVSTQIVSRERFAYFLFLLSLLGSTLERFATEIRHLHRTEVDEAKEPFYSGQKGSSAMPHKQNPILSERICGLARLLRSNAFAASENINLWHERDISHSSVERVIIPDSTIIIDYMLQKFKEIVSKIKVNPKNMIRNIELNRGIIYSQKILTELMKKGLPRMDAYDLIQNISLEVINNNSNFKEEIFKNKRIKNILDEKILNKIFDPYSYLSNIDKIYKRFNLS